MSEILEKDFTIEEKVYIETLFSPWKYTHDQILKIEKKIRDQADEDSELETIYRSIPGVGVTGARILANELGDISQISNERKLFSYTGLTPCEHSSGGHRRLEHISRQGKPLLRKVLVQVAWCSIYVDTELGV